MIYQISRTYIKRSTVIAETTSKEIANDIVKTQREIVKKDSAKYCGQVLFTIKAVSKGELIQQKL